MTGRFDGRVAIVTGGAGGIGRATAARLAGEGARVAILDRAGDAAEAAAAELPGALGFAVDVTDAAGVDAAVDGVAAELGSVDVLVNNAGITRDNLLFRMGDDDWDAVIGVHLRGAFLMARAAQRHMVAARYGRIVSLTSVAATGNRGQANYSAAKAGLQGFTKTLAIELGPFGITANAVGPGFIATEMTDATARRVGMEPDEYRAQTAAITPVRRVGEPADVAATIAWLASEEAGFVTGQVVYVDGGLDL
ncbi:3-oxoacyl-ACP reductase FabG [Schumannella sp. 10F1B-5-1]|uniref:3-oxoacyl-ACP reductase FabG n=1 Tax=Schumannella sp. 10F1B-5-1 TaxID=2590780 RepID=UPI001130F841|nr:3-oxoacyl-ACP reductase FabG [Schumannella sp. 10F1B-5-1]TPW78268.1 SDR family oxidoreductase [Schumannella sp. 10F1B-5-1]